VIKPEETVMTDEQKKMMRTQDIRYVEMKRVAEMKVWLILMYLSVCGSIPLTVEINGISVCIFQKIERMKSELHFLDVNEEKKNKHVFYVDSKKEGNLV